jgi:hypothetical protein
MRRIGINWKREGGVKNEQGEETEKRNLDRYVIEISRQKYWKLGPGRVREIPEPLERKKSVMEMHVELVHKRTGVVHCRLEAE